MSQVSKYRCSASARAPSATATEFFNAWGATGVKEATRIVDICLDAGVTMFDTADVYSGGRSEEVLGKAIAGRRATTIIATKASFRTGPGENDLGNSRHHLISACEASLRRLGTDYIDLYQMHGFDALSPVEETLSTLDTLVRSGKVRYIGCSNFSGWHLMKSLAASDRHGWPRYVAHQAYYSLVGRDFEWELMPLGHDQGVGTLVWSPLGWGRLTGKIRREPAAAGSQPPAENGAPSARRSPTNICTRSSMPLTRSRRKPARRVPQIALNWLMQRPTISSVIIGARNEEQLRQNLGAVGWSLDGGADGEARRRERAAAAVSLLAPAPGRRPQPAARLMIPASLRQPDLGRMAAVRHAFHPAVRVRLGVGRPRLLPGRRRSQRTAHRHAAVADARGRHAGVVVPDHAGRSARPRAGAHRRRAADDRGRHRVRVHQPLLAASRCGHDRRHQPERKRSRARSFPSNRPRWRR